ncbi:XisI protein [Moorena sp. SIO4G3]|uniref:XisI protein n=1 Tax=Moorena sp. SIO4G3 TaxID=2607821 RepID=UPI0025FC99E8|nr:XisI protein [Moorena sp. SIO4G3]
MQHLTEKAMQRGLGGFPHERLHQDTDQYLIISEGWNNQEHLHSCLIHVEILNSKIWIQCDNTEDGIANDLVAAGIPKSDIVLAFHPPDVRKFTEFAVS